MEILFSFAEGFDVSDEIIIDAIEHGTLPEMSKGVFFQIYLF